MKTGFSLKTKLERFIIRERSFLTKTTQSENLRADIAYVVARLFRQCQTPQGAQKCL